MAMRLKTVQFVSLVLVILVTGVFWGSWLGLSRSMETFTPDTFLAIGHTMIGNLGPVMAVLVSFAVLSQVVLLVQLRSSGSNAFLPSRSRGPRDRWSSGGAAEEFRKIPSAIMKYGMGNKQRFCRTVGLLT